MSKLLVLNTDAATTADRYHLVTGRLSDFIKKHSLPIKTNPDATFVDFMEKGGEEQERFLSKISLLNDVCSEAIDNEIGIFNDTRFLWGAFRRLGAIPSADLLTRLDPKDFIELYDIYGVQVFANLEFCKIVSYTIEEMLLYSWMELYRRDNQYTEQIMTGVSDVLTKATGPFEPAVSKHLGYEKRSNSGLSFMVEMKMFAPLFDQQGRRAFFLATSKIDQILT